MWLLSNFFGYLIAGIVGSAIFIFLSKKFQNFINVLRVRYRLKSIQTFEVENRQQCRIACWCIKSDCKIFSALGFDCEWRTVNGKQRPVALLQLATVRGFCCLFRLNILENIPEELQDILSDSKILKLGIDPLGDSKHIWKQYKVQVSSTLDLRNLYQVNKSLASLSADEIGIKLNKDLKIRCSNWEIPKLTDLQKEYAATDAFVAIEIFKKWLLMKNKTFTLWKIEPHYYELLYKNFEPEISRYLDISFSQKIASSLCVQSNKKAVHNAQNQNISGSTNVIRKSPLYDNCFMHAPDGELLCSCDKRKAQWYVDKGLAQIIPGEPHSIRLLFEPAARADDLNGGRFYQQLKQNCCVVCGASDSYLRHNVVPKEYRKFFPNIMKDHQSHDVVLMCLKCHHLASQHNEVLRQKLAEKCQAPTHTTNKTQNTEVLLIKKYAKALLTAGDHIPKERKTYLTNKIKNYMQRNEITEILQEAANLDSNIDCKTSEPHGLKVVNYFINEGYGLTELEVLWRTHFLDTMKPQFLPTLWSVTHNHERVHASLQKNLQSKTFFINSLSDH